VQGVSPGAGPTAIGGRYFLLGGLGGVGLGGDTRGTSGATTAVTSVCATVPAGSWGGGATQGATLYDCAGKASQLAAATT
jgi:hypothetical protein